MCAMSPRLLRPRLSFDPRRIAGLEVWWDASVRNSLSLNENDPANPLVSEWRDLSGNGRTAFVTNAQNQPQYSATGWNGKPAVTFTAGDSKFLEFTPFALTTQTAFLMIEPTTSTAAGTILNNITATAGTYNRWGFITAAGYQTYSAALGAAVSGLVNSVGANLFAQSRMLISHTYNNQGSTTVGNHGIRKDRSAVTTLSSSLFLGSGGNARGRIGCRSPGSGGIDDDFISARYAMILLYNRVLSAAEISAVENWAVSRYPL